MLAALKPHRKDLVFDLVEATGFDTTDWVQSFKHVTGYKANPSIATSGRMCSPES